MGTDGFAHCEDGDTMCSLQHGGGTWTSHIWTQTSPDPFHVHRLKLNQFGASVSVSHVVNVGSCRRGFLYCVHEQPSNLTSVAHSACVFAGLVIWLNQMALLLTDVMHYNTEGMKAMT